LAFGVNGSGLSVGRCNGHGPKSRISGGRGCGFNNS
jgi:hypothetical protein